MQSFELMPTLFWGRGDREATLATLRMPRPAALRAAAVCKNGDGSRDA